MISSRTRNMDRLLLTMFILIAIALSMATLVPSKAAAVGDDCPISKCWDDGPIINFPFRLKDDPPHCGDPEFEVSCLGNTTMMQLSSTSGLFPVQKIDYQVKRFVVYDENGCLPRRLLNFTFSTSSLFYYLVTRTCDYGYSFPNMTLLNCSTAQNLSTVSLNANFVPIRCLSVPGHHQILAVSTGTSLTDLPVTTCGTLTQLYLPLQEANLNDSYHCGPSNAILMRWKPWYDFPACRNCTQGRCDFNNSSNQLECYPSDPVFPYSDPPHHQKGLEPTIVGVTVACFALVSAIVGAIFYLVRQSTSTEDKENQMRVEKFLNDHRFHVPTRYSYADIKKMTNGFKNKLGEGGFGCVYSGKLPNGIPVAIKVLMDSNGNGDDFVNEVGTIGRIHHVNVVRLLGFSAEGGKRAVIYELMPNRSLEKFISSKEKSSNASFDWGKLHSIVTGIAKGIEYLHQGCEQRILHLDIKPHNILLDHEFNPKISDFGLAKLCSKEDSFISMISARGTVGYIAPEVFNGNFGSVSHKSDVYSFGMLVLEIAGAMMEPALTSSSNEDYFPELVYNRLIQGEALGLRLEIGGDDHHQIAKKLVIVALWCIQWYPVNRPSMKAVVRMLEGASENLIIPPNPFASTSSAQTEPATLSS